MMSSGAFPNVAFRKPPIPGSGVVRRVLGRLADQPGERDERRGSEDEQRDVADVREAVEQHHHRAQREERVEAPPDQARGTLLTSLPVLDAVLFDWGDTLFHFAYEEDLLEAGWEAGLATLEQDGLPGARGDGRQLPRALPPAPLRTRAGGRGRVSRPHARDPRRLRRRDRRTTSSTASSPPSTQPGAGAAAGTQTHALLDALRERGLKLGLVSNAFDPGWLLQEDLERMGLAERLDTAVFSSEVGKRKPHPADLPQRRSTRSASSRSARSSSATAA